MVGSLLAPVLILCGCAPAPPVADREIVAAGLGQFSLGRGAAVVGFLDGDAILVFEEPDGTTDAVSVALRGGTIGVVFDASGDPDGNHSVPLDLSDVDGPVMLHDLFGTYRGTGAGAGLLIGGQERRMRNGRGVSFREDHLTLGLGIHAGFEWLRMVEGGNDLERTDPPGVVPRVESGGGCSGPPPGGDTGLGGGAPSGAPAGTAPTGTVPTGVVDTGPVQQPPASQGCGCSEGDDSPTTGTPTGTPTGGTTTTQPTTTDPPTGTDEDPPATSSSSSCGDAGCGSSACDHGGGGRLPPLLALLLGLAIRRSGRVRP